MQQSPFTKKVSTVLLEDDMVARLTLEHFCQNYPGIELKKEFEDIDEAILYLKDNPVDLVFLDIQLRSSNGFDLLSHLPAETKVIVTTGDPENKTLAEKYHVADFLIKPISLEAFQKSISHLHSERA
jgi:response regulator of citrate/malate metabolism